MAMGSTGTVNMSAQMFKDITTAVEEYEKTAATLKKNLESEINGLVGKDFVGAAADGFKAFYESNIEPANGDGLTKLMTAIKEIADAALKAIPGEDGLDDQLADASNNAGSDAAASA